MGPANGLDQDCAVALDNVVTDPVEHLGRTVGYLSATREDDLARAVVLAYDLDLPLSRWPRGNGPLWSDRR